MDKQAFKAVDVSLVSKLCNVGDMSTTLDAHLPKCSSSLMIGAYLSYGMNVRNSIEPRKKVQKSS